MNTSNNPGTSEQMPTVLNNEMAVDVSTMQALTKAELQQNIDTARANPRSLTSFQRDCRTMATLTPEVAQECFYVLPPRKGGDGKPIQGPSVRLAEIVVSSWGNCRVGSRVIEEGRDFIVAQGQFHDLERGIVISSEVRRRIVDKNGRRYSLDMIGTTANAACSIARRNAVFQGIPKALWAGIYRECLAVVRGDAKTMATRRAEALDTLGKMGATKQMVFDALEVKGIEDIGLDEIVTLGGWANAIREGEAEFDDVFAPKDAKPSENAGTSRIAAAKAALGGQQPVVAITEAEARGSIAEAKSLDDLEARWKTICDNYLATARQRPLELDGAQNDKREALKQAAGK